MTAQMTINSYWGPRPERPAELAGRCRQLLGTLASISPSFSNWSFVGRAPSSVTGQYKGPDGVANFFRDQYRTVALQDLPGDGLANLIEAGVCRNSDDSPVPLSGYLFGAFTGSGRDTQSISLDAHTGNSYLDNYYVNSVQIKTRPICSQNRSTFTLPVLTAMMFAIARAWDATWASIYPDDLAALWPPPYMKQRPSFNLAWVTYLSPHFAPMVMPPRSAIVEYTQQGGLVMTATNDWFNVINPAHLAVARDIEAAMVPVNALPWPPEAAPES
jgi:hypothetical protein